MQTSVSFSLQNKFSCKCLLNCFLYSPHSLRNTTRSFASIKTEFWRKENLLLSVQRFDQRESMFCGMNQLARLISSGFHRFLMKLMQQDVWWKFTSLVIVSYMNEMKWNFGPSEESPPPPKLTKWTISPPDWNSWK